MIADVARTMPHTLRSLEVTDEITAELTALVGSLRESQAVTDMATDPRARAADVGSDTLEGPCGPELRSGSR